MAQLTHEQYDALERAIIDGRRISVHRRGTEFVVVPLALQLREGRETIETRHPTTGESLRFFLDDVESVDVF
ncbi:MAG: hypothetical protein M3068_11030 [Gemmatimonadota bacterium]|nr:hypothetical protein [Gemmatimonadota bacterium]